MKKLLSLLSVVTISGTILPNVIAASPYQIQENKIVNNKINYEQINNLELKRNKRQNNNKININFDETLVNFNTSESLLQLSAFLVGNTSFTFYKYSDINITKFTNVRNWNDLTKKFNFIQFNKSNLITLALDDDYGGVVISAFDPKDIDISSLCELRHGYEGRGTGFSKIQLGAKTSYEPQAIEDLPFNCYSENLFSKTRPRGISYNKVNIDVSAVKLIPNNKDDDLILRLVYRIKRIYIASSDGIKLNGSLNNGNITLIKK